MSIGTFADYATREHIKTTHKQKKIVFGERPTTISAQSLKATSRAADRDASNEQSTMMTQSTQNNISQVGDGTTAKDQRTSPIYILNTEMRALLVFKIMMGLIAVPNVMFNLFFIAFGYKMSPDIELIYKLNRISEILFVLEIIQHFFTCYRDTETFENVYSLRRIAKHYVIEGSFLIHFVAAFPFAEIFGVKDEQSIRDLLALKLVRISRCSTDFFPEDTLLTLMTNLYVVEDRDDKIANDRLAINIIKIVKQVLQTLIITYFLGLIWFRYSDNWQELFSDGPFDETWVVNFSLRRPKYEQHLGEVMVTSDQLVRSMYYALTTLSTVGYGDYYPVSVAEKIFGSIIQIFGVTFFSILMNGFIEVVQSIKGTSLSSNEDDLQRWFALIRKIKNQPNGAGQDIDPKLKQDIESHFRYFWENDRTAVLLEKKEYFDSIPFKIQEHIMCKFLFEDIIERAAFKNFFRPGREFDSNFVYEVAFGFRPRKFDNNEDDRYILTEEGDVTEIYFIINGEWAVAFDSHQKQNTGFNFSDEFELPPGTDDLRDKVMIAKKRLNYGYIGDYYVFASKRSAFHYIALSPVHTFALTKKFMFKEIFKKFPGLHSEMLAESFSRYIKEFRKPCGAKRKQAIERQNKRNVHTQILIGAQQTPDAKKTTTPTPGGGQQLKRSNSRTRIFEKQEELKQYKEQLDILNEKANTMFEHMKQINKLVNKKIMDIENAVTKSEAIFVEEINNLIKNKGDLQKLEKRSHTAARN